jgi:hypothetical protein
MVDLMNRLVEAHFAPELLTICVDYFVGFSESLARQKTEPNVSKCLSQCIGKSLLITMSNCEKLPFGFLVNPSQICGASF